MGDLRIVNPLGGFPFFLFYFNSTHGKRFSEVDPLEDKHYIQKRKLEYFIDLHLLHSRYTKPPIKETTILRQWIRWKLKRWPPRK